jgi:restriction system protein
MSRDELSRTVASSEYGGKPLQVQSLIVNILWNFYHVIVPGDFVIARRGRKTLAAVGKVIQPAIYAKGKNPNNHHPNFLGVEWQEQPRERVFANLVFPMQTLSEISEPQYRNLVEDPTSVVPPVSPEPIEATKDSEATEDLSAFVLEKYLEEFIVTNFDTIFKRDLKIYAETDVDDGRQYPTDIGPIDILAFEPKSNSFVVIELKKGRPSDQVIGQILRYMGWVKKQLCKEGQGVKGLVICRDPDLKLSYALEMTNNINVQYYKMSFKLTETP